MLNLRKQIKRRKPCFIRQDAQKIKEIEPKWRKPKGIHSKMRRKLRGHRKSPSPGYGSPKAVRGIDNSGLKPVRVSSTKDLDKIDPKKQGVILSATVGLRKKIEIIKKTIDKKIKILNLKDPARFLKDTEENMKKRKEAKESKEKEKEKKVKEKEKKSAEKKKEKLAEKLTDDEKKEKEKKEKDKLLTKKEA
jgi:large subunit ribosomal protein L32e